MDGSPQYSRGLAPQKYKNKTIRERAVPWRAPVSLFFFAEIPIRRPRNDIDGLSSRLSGEWLGRHRYPVNRTAIMLPTEPFASIPRTAWLSESIRRRVCAALTSERLGAI